MGYEEYQREWIVNQSENAPECGVGDLVTFTVIVTCGGRRPYVEGVYVPSSNTIKGDDEYDIQITGESPRTIVFTRRQGGLITGTWTAVDTGSWLGDG